MGMETSLAARRSTRAKMSCAVYHPGLSRPMGRFGGQAAVVGANLRGSTPVVQPPRFNYRFWHEVSLGIR